MNTKFSLHVPPNMWREFKKSMLESRMFNEEVIGFFFCQRHQVSKRKVRYIPKSWLFLLLNATNINLLMD